jgi:predicted nuclease of predicted toxin-antitoxin system
MKLLFDQNLSPRLPQLLSDIFPDSVHVRALGLTTADDISIWDFAKANGFVIVSKDSDFQQRSLLYGLPPKFIWLRLGNCSVTDSVSLLRKHAELIRGFGKDSAQSHLILP